MEMKTILNEKQAKHFEIEGDLWAFADYGWRNDLDGNINLLFQDGLGFLSINIDVEGAISRQRYNFEDKRWQDVSE